MTERKTEAGYVVQGNGVPVCPGVACRCGEAGVRCPAHDRVGAPAPRKPHVKLVGEDGNAFAILGACQKAAQKDRWDGVRLRVFLKEATAGDYDHLLQTAMKYFDVR